MLIFPSQLALDQEKTLQASRSFSVDSLPAPSIPELKDEFSCSDNQGNRVERGEEYLDEDGSFYLRCPTEGTESAVVACADHDGRRRQIGARWHTSDGFFVNECAIGPPGPTTHRTVACVAGESGREVGNGSEWLVGRFYQACALDPQHSGWSFIKVVACEDDYGNRVVNGTEWPSREAMYYRRCALDSGDGQNRIVTVACTNEDGRRVEDGGSWHSLDGLFTKTCRIDPVAGSGQIESARRVGVTTVDPRGGQRVRGCVDDEGNLVSNGTEWEVGGGRFLRACVVRKGAAFVPIVACIDDAGTRVLNGTEWPSLDFLYFQRCQLDAGDGRNRIFTIACADDKGDQRKHGQVWLSRDGARKKCVLNDEKVKPALSHDACCSQSILQGTGQIEILDYDQLAVVGQSNSIATSPSTSKVLY